MPKTTFKSSCSSIYYIENRPSGKTSTIGSMVVGTGFLINRELGLIATVAHVVDGILASELWLRKTYNKDGDYALSPLMSAKCIYFHHDFDIALIQVHKTHTKGSHPLCLEHPDCPVGAQVVIPGYAYGMNLVWLDELLGKGAPKSISPIQTHAYIAAIVPNDGIRPVHACVYDGATFPGQSGSPVIDTQSNKVIAIHTNSFNNMIGYGVPSRILKEFENDVVNKIAIARDECTLMDALDVSLDELITLKIPSEKDIKIDGRKWRIMPNDPDPLPSNPHAHLLGTRLKLHLGTGDLYNKSNIVSSISKKELERIRSKAKEFGLSLP